MIIAKNKNQADILRRNVVQLVDALNALIESYNLTGLPLIRTTAELRKFGKAPAKYWEEQVKKRMEEKSMLDADLNTFAQLFKLEFSMNGYQKQSYSLDLLEYIRISNGRAASVEDLDKRLDGMGTTETTTPEEDQVARELMRTFRDFTYWSTILTGVTDGQIITRGTLSLGFSPMALGQLSLDTVNRAVEAMGRMDKKQFNALLAEQSGNQVWNEFE